MPKAKATCKGIAGVKGPDQKAILAPKAVHHQGETVQASIAHITQGDQKITSATIKHTRKLLRVMFCFSQHPSLRIKYLILFIVSFASLSLTLVGKVLA